MEAEEAVVLLIFTFLAIITGLSIQNPDPRLMQISPEWILGVFIALATVISTLAGIIYKLMTSRLSAQDKIIENLQDDVDRLSKGCGMVDCLWKERG